MRIETGQKSPLYNLKKSESVFGYIIEGYSDTLDEIAGKPYLYVLWCVCEVGNAFCAVCMAIASAASAVI